MADIDEWYIPEDFRSEVSGHLQSLLLFLPLSRHAAPVSLLGWLAVSTYTVAASHISWKRRVEDGMRGKRGKELAPVIFVSVIIRGESDVCVFVDLCISLSTTFFSSAHGQSSFPFAFVLVRLPSVYTPYERSVCPFVSYRHHRHHQLPVLSFFLSFMSCPFFVFLFVSCFLVLLCRITRLSKRMVMTVEFSSVRWLNASQTGESSTSRRATSQRFVLKWYEDRPPNKKKKKRKEGA